MVGMTILDPDMVKACLVRWRQGEEGQGEGAILQFHALYLQGDVIFQVQLLAG